MSAAGVTGIAGTGRVAQALGRLLAAAGEPVAFVAGRDAARAAAAASFIAHGAQAVSFDHLAARAQQVIIAVSDDAIASVAGRLAAAGMRSGAALHTCGARGSDELAALQSAGVSCGVLHPLQTVATAERGVAALPGAWFAVAGDAAASAWARHICELLGAKTLAVAPDRMPLYHAAAALASNYVTGLLDAAVILMKTAGIEEETALDALGPLVRASVENTLALGPVKALTGPLRRGDVETVRRHLLSLAGAPPLARELYRSAGLHTLDVARRAGLAEPQARALEALLREGR